RLPPASKPARRKRVLHHFLGSLLLMQISALLVGNVGAGCAALLEIGRHGRRIVRLQTIGIITSTGDGLGMLQVILDEVAGFLFVGFGWRRWRWSRWNVRHRGRAWIEHEATGRAGRSRLWFWSSHRNRRGRGRGRGRGRWDRRGGL